MNIEKNILTDKNYVNSYYTEMAKHSIKHVNSPFYIQTLFQTIHYII
jgi:hypothetical protein